MLKPALLLKKHLPPRDLISLRTPGVKSYQISRQPTKWCHPQLPPLLSSLQRSAKTRTTNEVEVQSLGTGAGSPTATQGRGRAAEGQQGLQH